MISRRTCLKASLLAGAASVFQTRLLHASSHAPMITRAIPKTGEKLPVVGLGSSATFSAAAGSEDIAALTSVFETMLQNGGTVFDTAPGYGRSEEVAGSIVQQLKATDEVFWATKVNVVPRGGSSADPAAARAQIERSFEFIGKDPIDLIQVHNLADLPTQLAILEEYKEEGRVRYIGTTCTSLSEYPRLAEAMRNAPLDFIGVDYAVDNRESAKTILPLAEDRGIAVLAYVPFGRTRLFRRVGDRPVPDWAQDIGIESWAQFFIKFVAAHPAVTVVTPATSDAEHMLDNLGGGRGELPDQAMQKRMVEFVEALPGA